MAIGPSGHRLGSAPSRVPRVPRLPALVRTGRGGGNSTSSGPEAMRGALLLSMDGLDDSNTLQYPIVQLFVIQTHCTLLGHYY